MSENENQELANAYFTQGDKYYYNDKYEQALENYLEGCDLIQIPPAYIKVNMGLCYHYLDDDIKCIQTFSLINIIELGYIANSDLNYMLIFLAYSYMNLNYYESALNVVNLNAKIKPDDEDIFTQVSILNQKILILKNLELFTEIKDCSDKIISLLIHSNEEKEFKEYNLSQAYMDKALSIIDGVSNKDSKLCLEKAKEHATCSDKRLELMDNISKLENNL